MCAAYVCPVSHRLLASAGIPVVWVASTQLAARACRQMLSSVDPLLDPALHHVVALDGDKLLGGPRFSSKALEVALGWAAEASPRQPVVQPGRLRVLAEEVLGAVLRPAALTTAEQPADLVGIANGALDALVAALERSSEQAVGAGGGSNWPPPEVAHLPSAAAQGLPPADWWRPSRLATSAEVLASVRLPPWPAKPAQPAAHLWRRAQHPPALPPVLQDIACQLAVYIQLLSGGASGLDESLAQAARLINAAMSRRAASASPTQTGPFCTQPP